jgi:hypothetical protein
VTQFVKSVQTVEQPIDEVAGDLVYIPKDSNGQSQYPLKNNHLTLWFFAIMFWLTEIHQTQGNDPAIQVSWRRLPLAEKRHLFNLVGLYTDVLLGKRSENSVAVSLPIFAQTIAFTASNNEAKESIDAIRNHWYDVATALRLLPY